MALTWQAHMDTENVNTQFVRLKLQIRRLLGNLWVCGWPVPMVSYTPFHLAGLRVPRHRNLRERRPQGLRESLHRDKALGIPKLPSLG